MSRKSVRSWSYLDGGVIVVDEGETIIKVHPNMPRWIVAANMARRKNVVGGQDRAFVLSITDRCNISCDFCCHPYMDSAFSEDDAVRMVKEACSLPFDEVCVTGGEPLTKRRLVYQLASICKSNGRLFGLITNGYWGRRREQAKRLAADMVDAGVARVTISWDPSHGEFVEPEAAQNCVDACMEAGMKVCLTGNFKKHGDCHANYGIDVSQYEKYANFVKFSFDIAAAGRAKDLDDYDSRTLGEEAGSLVCPGRISQELVVYSRDGLVQPCCSVYAGYDMPKLSIGDWRTQSVAELLDRQQGDGYFRVLVDGGFRLLLEILDERAPEIAARLPNIEETMSACHMCEAVMRGPDASEIRKICDDYLTDRLVEHLSSRPDALALATAL